MGGLTCIYCGGPTGTPYDEHEICAERSMSNALDPQPTVIDLFAGPGGWDIAARQLGMDPLGIEWDDAACGTRHAAGLSTLQADVAELDPAVFHPIDGLIASPPCQAFSRAGKGRGHHNRDIIDGLIADLAGGRDTRHAIGGMLAESDDALFGFHVADPRALLVVEPLRWTLKLRPQWVVLEQVPSVLPLWEMCATALERYGYNTWTGILSAEEYGVPQTRKRAILMAHQEHVAQSPAPTHTAYRKGKPRQAEGLLPWVSMADALGWQDGAVGFPRRNDRDDGGDYRERDLRLVEEPAFVLTEKARSWTRFGATYVSSRHANSARRVALEPAPTIAYGHAACDAAWIASGDVGDSARMRRGDVDAERVTVEEAAVLQTFPADYPWRGTRSKVFEQIGNAIPPLLALAVLRAVS